ncbi:MAG: Rad52/Rad22 family DNA repair protein [Arcobacteraceae bacterium]
MFTQEQIKSLSQELDPNRIKTREKGNLNLSYLEGFDIIESANAIFGYGHWDYAISKLEVVSEELNSNQNHIICYKAIVQVLVHNKDHTQDVSREDVGFGSGIAKTLADAHESGAKEAVTDALKRALRSFGNQFGNSLYDKTKNHQTQQQPQQQKIRQPANNKTAQKSSSIDQYEYASLYRLGLEIIENNGYLIVTGDDIFSKKDSIKACGFHWDSKSKSWYKPIQQAA